jgi:hypothetical protein
MSRIQLIDWTHRSAASLASLVPAALVFAALVAPAGYTYAQGHESPAQPSSALASPTALKPAAAGVIELPRVVIKGKRTAQQPATSAAPSAGTSTSHSAGTGTAAASTAP